MAEGLLRAEAGDEYDVFSAGTHPSRVNPLAIIAMREIGIDISEHRSQSVDDFAERQFDYVVTVCDSARDSCPFLPAVIRNIHRSFDDPSAVTGTDDMRLEAFRRVRDEIRNWLRTEFEGVR